MPELLKRVALGWSAVALLAAPAFGQPWWGYGDIPLGPGAYSLTGPYGWDGRYGLEGGYETYDGDDWYYDYYDAGSRFGARGVGGEYDDAYLDYSIGDVDPRTRFDARDVDGLGDDRPWYGDTSMDPDTLPDEDSYEPGGVYEGYGFDRYGV